MTTAVDPKNAVAMQAARVLAEKYFIDPEGHGDFLDWVYIEEPPQAGSMSAGGKIKFQKWPHIVELAMQLQKPWTMREQGLTPGPEDLKTVDGKARQVGASYDVDAFAVWLFWSKRNSYIPLMSQGETEAAILLGKARDIWENLPEEWKSPLGKDSGSEMTLPSMHSTIIALPSTMKAGRSATGTLVVMDEADYHEYLPECMAAIKPTIDSGGQIILISTVNKLKSGSMFQGIYREAMAGTNGWKKIFTPYTARPGRDAVWYDNTMRSIPEEQLKGMSRELYMEQEYPIDEQQMLAAPRTVSFFNHYSLDSIKENTREPIMRFPVNTGDMNADGTVKTFDLNIYQRPNNSHRYAAGTDTSHGVGRDYSVTVVLDLTSMDVVADIYTNQIVAADLVAGSIQLLDLFFNPVWAIENNDYGRTTARGARDAGYKGKLYYQETKQTKGAHKRIAAEPGWRMDGRNRVDVWNDLKPMVDDIRIGLPSKQGLQHFYDVIAEADNNYRPEARAGSHDDYCIAVGLAYQMNAHSFAVQTEPAIIGRRW